MVLPFTAEPCTIDPRSDFDNNNFYFAPLSQTGTSDFNGAAADNVSGAERSGEDGIEVRYGALNDDVILQRQDWSMATGERIEVYCRATFSEAGDLRLIATRLSDGAVVFDIDETGLDLWRGESADHFVRPKWGIYRSILALDNLRPEEEQVQFANFNVSKVMRIN